MDTDTIVLLVITVAALAGAFFTVVPVLPGTLFVVAGAVACGALLGWDELPVWFWAVQAVLVAIYLLIDNIAQLLGVKRVGGSRQAMWGGAIGVFVGPLVLALLLGPFALFIGPPIGAVAGTLIGEERARRTAGTQPATDRDYRRLGVGALLAFVIGTTTKLVVIAIQTGLLIYVAR